MPRPPRLLLIGLAGAAFACAAGCTLLGFGRTGGDRHDGKNVPAPPNPVAARSEFRVSQFVFMHDFELNRNLPIFRELAGLREQIFKDLQLPQSSAPVYVHLFEDRERYEKHMQERYPELPKRRAFFIAQPNPIGGGEKLLVFTYWGERIQQDLRHELTHALLHSVLKDVPIWLDEGLAEYYEMAPGWRGVNYTHLTQLRGVPLKADLSRLERLEKVEDMTPAEYRESWAWVHLMLNGGTEGRRVLLGYLRELRTNGRPAPLRPRLQQVFPAPDLALDRHLAALDRDRPEATANR
jgi:hypothetical protein